MPKQPYKRPHSIRDYIVQPNLIVEANANEKASVSFKDASKDTRRRRRREIEKTLNESVDMQNLLKYLATISLCIGNFYFLLEGIFLCFKSCRIRLLEL